MKVLSFLAVFFLAASPAFAEMAPLSMGETFFRLKDNGASRNVVLVHGPKMPSWTMDTLANHLSRKGFNVLQYDMFGMGQSVSLDVDSYTREIFRRQLSELIDHVGWSDSSLPLYLVGERTGATIAAMYAATKTDIVESLFLISPAIDLRSTQGFWAGMLSMVMRQFPDSQYLRDQLRKKIENNLEEQVAHLPSFRRRMALSRLKRALKGEKFIDSLYRRMTGDLFDDSLFTYRYLAVHSFPLMMVAGEKDVSLPSHHLHQIRFLYNRPSAIQIDIYKNMGSEITATKTKEIVEKIDRFFATPE